MPVRTRATAAVAALACVALAACDTGDGTTLKPPVGVDGGPIVVTTVPFDPVTGGALGDEQLNPAGVEGFTVFLPWLDGASIDPIYTCDGADLSPAVSWSVPPLGTAEIGIVLADESAIDDAGEPLVHWAVAKIAADEITLFENTVPNGAVEGISYEGTLGYRGPCPPVGQPAHAYRLTVYALNVSLELADELTAAEMADLFEASALASTDIVGTYQR